VDKRAIVIERHLFFILSFSYHEEKNTADHWHNQQGNNTAAML